ncbi:MAG: GIY-YIG nuclease family protein, partial [Weeksellaceae bacterium]|nr:GIY-YIG nuclease family protein [Weeksellaceae bacterium]
LETLDDILSDDDLGLLDDEGDTSIFEFKYTPKEGSRANADYIAQRKSISERDFQKYDQMFKQVHKELKEGKRKLLNFTNAEDNLIEGNFYLVDGLLCYLEVSKAEKVVKENKSGDRIRLEGRTVTIFENGTISNMLFRSLGKAIQKNGKIVTNTDEGIYNQLQENFNSVQEEDVPSGWIYVLKSKSENPEIKSLENLYKIGFSKNPVQERIKNASKEATYLFADVEIIDSRACFNVNIQKLEGLIHRFFAEACLDIDLYDKSGNRYIPREWFVVPLHVIDEVIQLLLNGNIVNYKYDYNSSQVVLK